MGIRADEINSTNNLIVRNTVIGYSTNYWIPLSNHYGVLISSPGTYFSIIQSWANFSL